jgi:hypothetical protein
MAVARRFASPAFARADEQAAFRSAKNGISQVFCAVIEISGFIICQDLRRLRAA